MTDEERSQRFAEVLMQEVDELRPRWCYLSFTDEDKGFLGGCFIYALGITDAIRRTHKLGINPGGQVLYMELSQENEEHIRDFEKHANKLLSFADMERLGMMPTKVKEFNDR